MTLCRFRRILAAALTVSVALTSTRPVEARQTEGEPASVERVTAMPAGATVAQDARETRKQFEELLRLLPPAVGRVLRLDHSLMRNESYLATYPALAAFLRAHPEVVNSPGYYLENVSLQSYPPEPRDARTEAIEMWRQAMEGFTILFVFLVVTGVVIWVIKSLIDWRRWSRTSRMQADVHNKLLDRFTANEDLLAYIQTPAGRRFLETAPIAIETRPRPVGAPFSRILWSVQAGVVLAMGAFGLLFISTRVMEEIAQVLFAFGVLALAVGIGFVASAGASFLLSRRLGLFDPMPAREPSDLSRV